MMGLRRREAPSRGDGELSSVHAGGYHNLKLLHTVILLKFCNRLQLQPSGSKLATLILMSHNERWMVLHRVVKGK